MEFKKLIFIPLLSLLFASFKTTVCTVSEKEINKTFSAIKYANNSNAKENLYSSNLDYENLEGKDKIYVNGPNICATIVYGSKNFRLASYASSGSTVRPDGDVRENYVATYVYKNPIPTITSSPKRNNNGTLDSISYTIETTNSLEIDISIEKEIGVGGNIYGVEAKAGIKQFFNNAVGVGAGNSLTLTYDLYNEELKFYSSYYIKKTTTYYEFITVVYIAEYSKSWSWFQWKYSWKTYSRYAYLTNSIFIDSYNLIEA